jgi:MoaA/NifB/PqqE/SkfB family radical SAM enzyme
VLVIQHSGQCEEKPVAKLEIKSDRYMYWYMLARCNFQCEYCFREFESQTNRFEAPQFQRFSPEQIRRQFDNTGFIWHIYMTGGEPLLYPHFIRIAAALTQNHYISLSTNLSTQNAYILADTIDPHRVASICASVHIHQREKKPDGLTELVRKTICFQNHGFNIRLSYLAYPPLLERIQKDICQLRDEGVNNVEVKIFQGEYGGRCYPRAYSSRDRALMNEIGLNSSEAAILASRVSFLGKKCKAGYKALVMDASGNITRCLALKNEYGNLFEGTFVPGTSSRRCTASQCICTYQGFRFARGSASTVPPQVRQRPVKLLLFAGDLLSRP